MTENTPDQEATDLLASWTASRALKAGLPPATASKIAQDIYQDARSMIERSTGPQENTT